MCEILTLSQTQKLPRPIPVLLYGRHYWQEVINFEALLQHGMISAQDLDLFRYVDSPAEALSALKEQLSEEMERVTPAFAKTSTPCCSPEEALARSHADADCHALDHATGTRIGDERSNPSMS